MITFNGSVKPGLIAAGVLAALLASGSALADDGVPLKITNDGTTDIVVTVYDLNASPRRVVVAAQRINGFATVPISVTAGADGMGNVAWTATTVDGVGRLCGRADRQNLANDTEVHVHADAPCTAT
jgi:Na+(H+)/acetate symporter ActP